MLLPWAGQEATAIDVTTRDHKVNPLASWTRVTFIKPNGDQSQFVNWPDAEQDVIPGFDSATAERLAEYMRKCGNTAQASYFAALLAEI